MGRAGAVPGRRRPEYHPRVNKALRRIFLWECRFRCTLLLQIEQEAPLVINRAEIRAEILHQVISAGIP
jgi:hypothetical protein